MLVFKIQVSHLDKDMVEHWNSPTLFHRTIYTTEAELLILPLFDTAVVYIID